ncbi:transcription repressor NadR [Acidaminobacter hydrogenoformans]|uniref:Uncharacterized protein n=1 Tax=Acidaminobacter hydrogenoformans DSM 2784 TaxID=1120920 RepID=A0A1G5RZ21_9FIRM|nr:transcription repressor NadR [Acidaminobacter hydrogenoformans]SCZ79246.1 hypothetical protein SAMN03080599_01668 [Acidaminobacter hydrogenoformans DSM 2784]
MTEERRIKIAALLQESEEAVTGSSLAKRFEVSRQVIVQDIAVLRASGLQIVSTSNGYLIPKPRRGVHIRTLQSVHSGLAALEEELSIIVEYGGRIIDVMVEHPVYGEIVVALMINSRSDLEDFIKKVKASDAMPLASLTDGKHYHTIEVPNSGVYDIIESKLRERGFIHL